MKDKTLPVTDSPKYPLLALLGVVIATAAFIVLGVPAYIPAAAVGTALFALAVVTDKKLIYTRVFVIIAFLACLLLTGKITQSLTYMSVFFPAGLALSFCLRKKKNINSSVAAMFFSMAVFILITGFAFVIEYGKDLSIESVIKPITVAYKEILGNVYDNLSGTVNYSAVFTSKDNFVYLLFTETVQVIPYFTAIAFLVITVLSYWLCKGVYVACEAMYPDNYKFFGGFIYIRVSRVGGVVYMIASLLVLLSTTQMERMYFENITMIMSAVFCYAGASVLGFLMKMYGLKAPLRYFVYFLLLMICILPMGLGSIVAIIGLIDSFWHLRRFIRPLGSRNV